MPGSPYLWMGMNAGNSAALFQATSGKDFKFCNGQYALTILGSNGNVGIGITAPQYKLSVSGTIGAKEVIVTNTGWPDYVFQPGYRLKPLREVGAYIREHQRLPDIPSDQEVRDNGISLGEMQARLLAKIEELTLHMIRAEERSNRLERQNQAHQERLAALERAGFNR